MYPKSFGQEILLSDKKTCQLYAGHRGAGKSTELLRLKADLEANDCFVVYFAADEEDIDTEDTQYADILLACTKHLLKALQDSANIHPIQAWVEHLWQDLKDLAQTRIEIDAVSVQTPAELFASLTASINAIPSERQKIRDRINPHTTTLTHALNQFIAEAKQKLPDGKSRLVVIADSLDRIAPVYQNNGRSNHEDIFLERSAQLKALDCNLIYTVPISLLYSRRATDVQDIYGNCQILPMIMVQTREGNPYPKGLEKLKEMIARRVQQVDPQLVLETDVFESAAVLEQLCLNSGGHARNLMLLVQSAVKRERELPIGAKALQRAITEMRDAYHRSVEGDRWSILARVSLTKQIANDDEHRDLLFNRCLLEYRYFDASGNLQRWYDVHPTIRGIQEFKKAVETLGAGDDGSH